MKYKIAHLADIQINLNTKNAERTAEYRSALFECGESIIKNQVDFVVLAGDIFERYETTDNERELYVQWVHRIMSALPNCVFIVIDGNHDVRKRNLQYYDGVQTAMQTNVLAEIAAAINSPRYLYQRDAAIYTMAQYPGIAFACWSELAKYDTELHRCPYGQGDSKLLNYQDSMIIDVYHGTLAGAKDLGTSFELPADDVKLRGHCAMLGHIHKHQAIGNAVYSSSLVQRSFNEGIRYTADQTIYDYRDSHGYVLWTVHPEMKSYKFEFVPVFQQTLMVTFVLDRNMTRDILLSKLAELSNRNIVLKLVLNNPNPEVLAFLYNYCSNKNITIKKVEAFQNPTQTVKTDTGVAKTLELNLEAFEDISTKLLKPRLDQLYGDNIEFSQSVLNKTIELLTQEAGYHLHPEERNRIRINKVIIDNFKTIGHAEINFLEHGLQALRGQNGQGKTTCFEAIAFAVTGQHNRTFKKNAKNKQFLRLFNDKQINKDVVLVEILAEINGKAYSIKVMLKKFMNEGWTAKNWRKFVTRVTKKLEVTAIDDDAELLVDDAAEAWLAQYFGTYEEFAILHLINQETLESLKYMSPEELTNFMLQRLGYSVLNKFQYFYGGCKNTEMQKVPKPTDKSYVQLSQESAATVTALDTVRQQITEKSEQVTAIEQELQTLRNSESVLWSKKQTVPNDLIAQWKAKTTGLTEDYLQSNIVQHTMNIQKLSEQFNANQEMIQKHQNLVKQVDESLQVLVDNAARFIQYKLAELQTASISIQSVVTKAIEDNAEIDKQKFQLQLQINTLHSNDTLSRTKLTTLTSELTNLQPGKCPLCQGVIKPEDFTKHKSELEQSISTLTAECDTIKTQMQALVQQLEQLPDKIDIEQQQADLRKYQDEIATYQSKLSQLNTYDYRQKLLQANLTDVYQKLQESQLAVNSLDMNLSDKITNLQNELLVMNSAVDAFKQLHAYDEILKQNDEVDKQIQQLRTELSNRQSELTEATSILETLKQRKLQYQNQLQNIQDLQLKVAAYDISQEALNQYKWLIFEALPNYLYSNVCSVINSFIEKQNLPSGIQPWLSETDFGTLLLRDRLDDGTPTERDIIEASGMEATIAGLVLCFALHDANLTVDFPMVLLDELSGKLSTGTEDDPTDYLKVLLDILLQAANRCQIMIIDHRIAQENFDDITKIVKDPVTNVSYTV